MIDSIVLNPQGAPPPGAADGNINDESFLPRILSIFYAVFDVRAGPKVVHQVPENSIRVPQKPPDSARSPNFASSARSPRWPYTPSTGAISESGSLARISDIEPLSLGVTRAHSLASVALTDSPATTNVDLQSVSEPSLERDYRSSPFMGPNQSGSGLAQSRPAALLDLTGNTGASTRLGQSTPLLDFDSISEYVIPKTRLCGRLVHCNTPKHRILGFPVIIQSDRYHRTDFRYNLCFVFDRWADLSCYEPVVRKCATVLMSCEVSSRCGYA